MYQLLELLWDGATGALIAGVMFQWGRSYERKQIADRAPPVDEGVDMRSRIGK